jgi:hypothetical protein
MQIASIGEQQRDGLRKGTPTVAKAIAQRGQDAHPGRMQGVARLLRGLGDDPPYVFKGYHKLKFYFFSVQCVKLFTTLSSFSLNRFNDAISLP